MTDTPYFITLTIMLLTLGFVMPYVNEFATGESVDNEVDNLIPEDKTSFLSFVGSMLKAFFWYFGDLPNWANLIKVTINFAWLYLLIRMIRGN